MQLNTIQLDTKQLDMVQCDMIRYNTLRYDATRLGWIRLHSTPKESIHFEFRWVSTQNLHHVGPMRGYGGWLIEVPLQTKLSL